jgi:hypothetical protein
MRAVAGYVGMRMYRGAAQRRSVRRSKMVSYPADVRRARSREVCTADMGTADMGG